MDHAAAERFVELTFCRGADHPGVGSSAVVSSRVPAFVRRCPEHGIVRARAAGLS
jgi:hypothetical protein